VTRLGQDDRGIDVRFHAEAEKFNLSALFGFPLGPRRPRVPAYWSELPMGIKWYDEADLSRLYGAEIKSPWGSSSSPSYQPTGTYLIKPRGPQHVFYRTKLDVRGWKTDRRHSALSLRMASDKIMLCACMCVCVSRVAENQICYCCSKEIHKAWRWNPCSWKRSLGGVTA
jgi:hypothetical protein